MVPVATERGAMSQERELAHQLQDMAQAAVADARIGDADLLVPILQFIGRVILVVEQAFDEVYALLIQLKYLKPEDLLEPRRTELLAGLEMVLQRSRYRDVEEICSRLHHLTEQYEQTIRPRLGTLADETQWRHVFNLLNQYEGAIINMVGQSVSVFREGLSRAKNNDLPALRMAAGRASDELRSALQGLWDLRNKIFGLSGNVGFLELLATGQRSEAIRGEQGPVRR